MYKLTLTEQSNQYQLNLIRSNLIIRTWYGSFAEYIYTHVLKQNKHLKSKELQLKKRQIQNIFTEITCLYQNLLYQNKIESDLINHAIPKNCFCIAESLLLHIRINKIHPSYDDLLSFFLNEFKNCDWDLFNKTINLLVNTQLIQSIITADGLQYFDKNIQPHDHIYFSKHKKLVDCSDEIAVIFQNKNNLSHLSHKFVSNIYYVNNRII